MKIFLVVEQVEGWEQRVFPASNWRQVWKCRVFTLAESIRWPLAFSHISCWTSEESIANTQEEERDELHDSERIDLVAPMDSFRSLI